MPVIPVTQEANIEGLWSRPALAKTVDLISKIRSTQNQVILNLEMNAFSLLESVLLS
jgi:hypothetical protein